MWSKISTAVAVVVLVTAGVLGFRMVRNQIEADVYRDRLVALNSEHEALRERYNQAVRKTAMTMLIVTQESVDVAIRTTEGDVRVIPTPYKPEDEIHVDYVGIDDRMWIRRIHDKFTAPSDATIIDSDLIDIDWEADGVDFGRTVYRNLTPGRWVVTVTGDGSLGLAPCDHCDEIDLVAAPEIREFEPIEDAQHEVERIGMGEVIGRVFGGG